MIDTKEPRPLPIYEDVEWLATAQRELQIEIGDFARRYSRAVRIDEHGRLRVLPVTRPRETKL